MGREVWLIVNTCQYNTDYYNQPCSGGVGNKRFKPFTAKCNNLTISFHSNTYSNAISIYVS